MPPRLTWAERQKAEQARQSRNRAAAAEHTTARAQTRATARAGLAAGTGSSSPSGSGQPDAGAGPSAPPSQQPPARAATEMSRQRLRRNDDGGPEVGWEPFAVGAFRGQHPFETARGRMAQDSGETSSSFVSSSSPESSSMGAESGDDSCLPCFRCGLALEACELVRFAFLSRLSAP